MTRPELRVTEADWRLLRRHLDRSFRSEEGNEAGALALIGEIETARRHVFTVIRVVLPQPGDIEATPHSLRFTSSYIRRVHLEMRRRGLAGIAAFHTHPLAHDTVDFSLFDDEQEPGLIENLAELAEGTRLVSVVFGAHVQCGRVWSAAGIEGLTDVTIVGERVDRLPLDGAPRPPAPDVAAAFDRGSAVTGRGAMAQLRSLTVGVVGVSGTGSIVAELLVRAGCGRVLLIEHDVVGDENLNRILHSSVRDVQARAPKVTVIADALGDTGLPTEVEAIRGNVLDQRVLARLRDADVIIGCVDRAWPRELLSAFSFRYLVPYIDLGTEIGTNETGTSLESLDARVSYVAPGRWCLPCAGYVDPRRVAFESATTAERGRIIAQGYSDDLLLTQPAVMELNMRAASLGVLVLRHLLQPILPEPLPVAIKENVAMLSLRAVTEPRSPNLSCPTCREHRDLGTADNGPTLGYSAEMVAARA